MRCDPSDLWRPSRYLCLFLSVAMALSPAAMLRAQEPAAVGKAFLTPQSVAVVTMRPKQILTNPALAMLPIEIAQAAGEKYLGMDAANITRVVVVGEPPMGATPFYAVFLQADQPWNLGRLAPELTAHTEPGQIENHACLVSQHPAMPCFMVLKDKTLVVASQGMLKKLMKKGRDPAEGVLADLVASHSPGDDLFVAVDMKALRPLIQLGLMGARQQTPPEFQKFLEIPTLLESVELTVNLDGSRATRLAFHAENSSDADKLQDLIDDGVVMAQMTMKAQMEQQLAQLRASDDPVERATAAYADRVSGNYLDMFLPVREGEDFVIFDTSNAEGGQQMATVAVIGILVALLLPAVQAAREAARRNQSMNNLKMLMLSLHNYHDANDWTFPAHAIYSDDGKPLLSWRVAILPYLEDNNLHKQFHLDEPWDSAHNKPLIAQMPALFASPNSTNDPNMGKSNYVAPVGKGLVFDGTSKGTKIAQMTDGTSNTIALLEVNDENAVIWTKPDDLKYDPENPMKGLGGVRPGGFLAGICDGSVQMIVDSIDPETLKAMFTKAGGEAIDY